MSSASVADVRPTRDRSDGDAEGVLSACGVEWKYEFIQLSDIDWVESERNRGRLKPTDDDLISAYAAEMKRGTSFPAICVRKNTVSGHRTAFTILGGVHRTKAKLRNGCTSALAIVVQCSPAIAQAIAGRLNAVMGRRTDEDERISQAIDMVRKHKWSLSDAAEFFSVERSTLSIKLRCFEAAEFMEARGIPRTASSSVSQDKLLKVSSIEAKPLRMAVAELAVASGSEMSAAEFKRRVDDVIRMDVPESERIELVRAEAAKCKRTKSAPKSMARSAASQMSNVIRMAESLAVKYPTVESACMNEEERDALRMRWRECSEKISTILGG